MHHLNIPCIEHSWRQDRSPHRASGYQKVAGHTRPILIGLKRSIIM